MRGITDTTWHTVACMPPSLTWSDGQAMPAEEYLAVATPQDSNKPHSSAASLSPEGHYADSDQLYAHDHEHDDGYSDDHDECEINGDDGPALTNPAGSPSSILHHLTLRLECCEETSLSKYFPSWNAKRSSTINRKRAFSSGNSKPFSTIPSHHFVQERAVMFSN